MVKPIFFLLLTTFLIFSCTKDEIVENLDLNNEEIILEQVSEVEKKEEPIIESNLDKTVNWVIQNQMPNGLLQSAENSELVSLYDNALASLVFIELGELSKAERILDFFKSKIQSELKANTGGFYQFRDPNGENGSRTWMGDNAWLLIAVNHYHNASGNQEYKYLADELEYWIRSLQDNDGGLRGGYNEDGTEIPKVSEGIITAFNAVPGYDDFHKNILNYLQQNRWHENENTIVAWPENPDYTYALDLHALSYTTFENFPENTLTQTERYLNTQIATVTGNEIQGYCFDEDKDVIWLEGTAQLAVAYQHSGNTPKSEKLLRELEKTIIGDGITNDLEGIPYTTNYGTNYGSNLLWDHADITPALSSTAWYIFAKKGFNPLLLGRQKNIPTTDQFW